MYFLRISSATRPSSIWSKASATASQVGFGALSSQQATISVLQRSSSPRWFFSMTPSCWIFKSRFTPSVCQRKTDFNSFASAFRVGVAGAAGGETIHKRCICVLIYQGLGLLTKLTLCQSSSVSSFSHFCCSPAGHTQYGRVAMAGSVYSTGVVPECQNV